MAGPVEVKNDDKALPLIDTMHMPLLVVVGEHVPVTPCTVANTVVDRV